MLTHTTVPEKLTDSQPESTGWQARLTLELCRRNGKSVVAHSSQKGPLTIQHPFYPEDDVCHLYLLHPPAGIVGGDRLGLSLSIREKGAALMTTPGATKFYRTNGQQAIQKQEFSVASGCSLEWLPQETIYFPQANGRLETSVRLQQQAHYIGWEIHCLGLPVNNEDFGRGKAVINFSLYRENTPLLIESIRISEEKKKFQAAFLRNEPVFGSLVATGADESLRDMLRQQLAESTDGQWGVTLLDDVLIIRYLGDDTNEARKLFVQAWTLLRPQVLGRKSCLPRIWAT